MREGLNKLRRVFRSPGLAAAARWSEGVRMQVLLSCLLSGVAILCSLGFTMATRGLVDSAVRCEMEALKRYGLLLGLCIAAEHAMSALSTLLRIHSAAKLQMSMQCMLMEKVLSRSYSDIKGYHSGELVNRFFSDVIIVKNGIMNVLPQLFGSVVSFAGAAVILIAMDWRFVVLMIMGGVLGLFLVLLFRGPMKMRHRQMQESEGTLHAAVQETMENVRLIKASVSEGRAVARIREAQELLRSRQVRQWVFRFRMNDSMDIAFDLSWLFCMIWGCLNISRGNITYGSLAAMIQLIGRIEGPIANAAGTAGEIYDVSSSAERILELTDLPEEEPGDVLTAFDSLRLENVAFGYDDGEEVLQHINWTIRRGDFMALTGISGGGKTTLFQLLLGIYRPSAGRIVFCDGDRKVPASRGTRKLFAYVPQGNTLFSGTLRDNLTMFAEGVSDEEIMAAAKAACIDHVVKEAGLDTWLGERGQGLSEGQAQRVAVARALLSGAPILLLDEATSALDEKTEEKLLRNISAMRDKTCIIVTHRRAALEICDYRLHILDGEMTIETQNDR